MPLLIREARGVRLSPPGEAFLHHARAMLEQTRQLQADLQEYGAGLRGHVRVFANTTAVTEFMPEVLATFLAGHPQVDVDLQEEDRRLPPGYRLRHPAQLGRVLQRLFMSMNVLHETFDVPEAHNEAMTAAVIAALGLVG